MDNEIANVREDEEKRESLCAVSSNKIGTATMENSMAVLQNAKNRTTVSF